MLEVQSAVMQANQFLLWDMEAEVEELSTSAGGWRRPFAVWLDNSSSFTIVLLKERQLKVLARLGSTSSSAAAVKQAAIPRSTHMHRNREPHSGHERQNPANDSSEPLEIDAIEGRAQAVEDTMHARALVLVPPHHGKIVHACVCLQVSAQEVAVVTAAEDGTVRVVCFRFASSNLPSSISRVWCGAVRRQLPQTRRR